MSGYLKNVTVKTVFDGDSVIAVLKPISFLDRVRIEDKLPSRDDSKEIQEQKRKSASEWLTKEIPQILGGYLVSVDGLKDAEGAPIAKESVLLDGYFTGLVGVIYQEWFAQRAPKDPTVPAGTTADASAIALSPSESLKSASAG